MTSRKHFGIVTVLVVVVAVGLYFLLRSLYALPVAASTQAGPIDIMFQAHFILIAFLFSLIMVFVLYASVVFRRKPGDETDGPHIHGHTGLEIAWTVIPIILVVGFGAWGTVTFNDLVRPQDNEMVVKVIGQQWAWSFEYPEQGGVKSPDLVLPIDRPIVLEMETIDVLHSFWVPEFRVKQDLVPGRITNLRLTPSKLSASDAPYKLRCAEICGTEHTNMLADVHVLSQAGFDEWVLARQELPKYADLTPEERGAVWYGPTGDGGFGCNACHSLDGTRIVGPSWLGLYGRQEEMEDGTVITADDEYIRNAILMPASQIVAGYANAMPAIYEEQFLALEAEVLANEGIEVDIIADLIDFIQTLEE